MRKVLIIDDEPWSRQVVKALGSWETLGLTVAGEAEDGRGGLAAIEERNPHIVITDMRMPGKDGVELLKELNERYPSLQLIVMSGFDDYAYLKQAVLSRAVDYLLKPIDPEELNAALRRCLAELERREEGAGLLQWRTPQLFAEPAALERYIEYRKLIQAFLLELNAVSLRTSFLQLEAFLMKELRGCENTRKLAAVGRDFLQLLEEFAKAEGVDLDSLRQAAEEGGAGTEGEWESLRELTEGLNRLFDAALQAIETQRRSRHRLDLEEVRFYLERHYLEQVTLETVAQRFHVSKEHLSRAFKAHAGENLTDFVIRRRMEKARELIAGQGVSIKQAAEMTGYPELAYFYRVFKKHFGYPPGELRGAGSLE